MRVICVNNESIERNFTVGKTYEVLKEFYGDDGFYSIRNDRGYKASVNKRFFEVVVEDKPTGVPTFDGDIAKNPELGFMDDSRYSFEGAPKIDYVLEDNFLTDVNGKVHLTRSGQIFGAVDKVEYLKDGDILPDIDLSHPRRDLPKGTKLDQGKLKPTLLLDDMPLAINEILKVLQFGAEKYSEGNWLKVPNGIDRYRNAADRHRLAIDELDDESGMMHLAHEATSILMLLELKLREKRDGKAK
ncbi:dATP/dGTP diphosphohydrolase domain-containing protein [Pseudomonas sp.]|uniref:dATP/dGTP diphosphohydrolase domain-containing protein n=1 Tax=Pseudomonas sp. TaxID=306 RepID=UPI0026111E7D|nr:dATP/dGTP diphosphohydrolase domain-containing protein [Pseudomonas sp.]